MRCVWCQALSNLLWICGSTRMWSSAKNLPYVSQFALTQAGKDRIFFRVKQHILVRGIANLDTALALVEVELSTPNVE